MPSNRYVSEFQKRLLLARSDADRLALHLEYLPAIVESCPAEAIVMANEGHRLMVRLGQWNVEPELLRHRAAAHLNLGNLEGASADLQTAYKWYGEPENNAGLARIGILLADVRVRQGQPVDCSELLKAALENARKAGEEVQADVLDAIGRFRLATSDYAGAIEHLRAAFAIYKRLGDHSGVGRALSGIGTAFAGLNDLDAAYDHHTQSLEAFRSAGDGHNESRTLANLAAVSLGRGLLQEALDMAARAHALCLLNDDQSAAASMRMMMGDIHARLDERDVALEHYLEAYKLLDKHPTDELLLALYHRIGTIHQGTGDPDAARHVFAQGLAIAERIHERRMAAQFHEALAAVLETLGEYKDALLQHRKFAALREEIAGEDSRNAIADLQARYEHEMMEQERARAESRTAELMEEIEVQREELAGTLRKLARLSAIVEKLKANLSRSRGSDGDKTMDGILEELSRDLSPGQTTDPEWKQIERAMDKLHLGFTARLFKACPQLAPAEVKICILTRLGYNTASIAETLGNEQRTVQTQRLRIRKKFGLTGDIDFAGFIANL